MPTSLDVPMTAPRVLATMEETHVNMKVTPEGRPLLAYSLAVPKAWAFSKQFGPVASGPFVNQGLGFFAISARPGSPVIAVTATPSLFEVPVDTWAVRTLAAEGWTVVSAKWFPGPYGPFFDVTGTRVIDDVEEVRRTSARNDGGNIVLVNCLCARTHWDEAKETFWAAHTTFELLAGTKQTKMEPWLSAAAKNPDFDAAYPTSWSAEAVASAPEGVSAVDIRLLDGRGETLLAYLQIKAEREGGGAKPASFDELQSTALSKLEVAGFAPSGRCRATSDEEDPRAAAVEGWLGGSSCEGRLAGTHVTARLGFVRRSAVACSFALLSPSIQDDTLAALRAQRAFEIARATLRIA